MRLRPEIANAGTGELLRNGSSGWIFIVRRCWASNPSGWYGVLNCLAGPALEQAAMEKLRTWASFLDPDVNHSAQVTRLALQLFDGLSTHGILTAAPEYRRILEAAALLHEVGRSRGPESHRKHAYSLIRRLKPPLGWSAEELQCVAVIARYHGGAIPQTSNSSFVGLPAKRRRNLLPIAGILRLADAFDFSHDRAIDRISVERRDGMVVIYAQGLQEISPAGERLARARYLLEATCGLPDHDSPPGRSNQRPHLTLQDTLVKWPPVRKRFISIQDQATDFFFL